MKIFRCKLATLNRVLLLGVMLTGMTSTVNATEDHKRQGNKDNTELSFGFFPIISTVALFKRFGPLRDYLSSQLDQPVALHTAKDFPTFVKRTDERRYDILVTAPHFALKAVDSGQYKIRTTLVSDVQQLVIVRTDSQIKDIKELSGKLVATPPKKALMTMMGMQYMSKAGLSGDSSPVYRHYMSHNAANEAVIAGEAVAAIASSNIVKKAIKQGAPLKIIGKGLKFPNMATLVATDKDKEIGDKVANALTGMKTDKQGQQVLKQIAFPGYRSVDVTEYEVVRPYLNQTLKK